MQLIRTDEQVMAAPVVINIDSKVPLLVDLVNTIRSLQPVTKLVRLQPFISKSLT